MRRASAQIKNTDAGSMTKLEYDMITAIDRADKKQSTKETPNKPFAQHLDLSKWLEANS
ncbi:hypothetical protein [Lacticaseibacillus salsurivasis]|uniref:hypothetical protein n=1 Tax=Lacticaseibacillus salsurivasis TaxID=3081441 RepID=UPI0030C70F9F